MPSSWHDHYAINRDVQPDKKELYHEIVANKKPYFMRYIYPTLMRQYNEYVKNGNKNAVRKFGMSVDELMAIPDADRTMPIREYLEYYHNRIPVGIGDCVMNRICRKFESEFDGFLVREKPSVKFDVSIMKRGCPYTELQLVKFSELYKEYCRRIKDYSFYLKYELVEDDEAVRVYAELKDNFINRFRALCTDRFTMCDILLDVCYKKNSTKKIVWELCGDEIIENLLLRNDMTMSFPTRDDGGDITYRGDKFSVQRIKLECFNESDSE